MTTVTTHRSLLAVTGALFLGLSACGGGTADPAQALDTAKRSVQEGDYEAALDSFQAVIENAEASPESRFQAMRDAVACEAQVNLDEGATRAWEALNKEFADRLDVNAMQKIGDDVARAGCTDTALTIIEVATGKAGGDEEAKAKLQVLADSIAKAASAAGDNAALEKLKSLGYVNN